MKKLLLTLLLFLSVGMVGYAADKMIVINDGNSSWSATNGYTAVTFTDNGTQIKMEGYATKSSGIALEKGGGYFAVTVNPSNLKITKVVVNAKATSTPTSLKCMVSNSPYEYYDAKPAGSSTRTYKTEWNGSNAGTPDNNEDNGTYSITTSPTDYTFTINNNYFVLFNCTTKGQIQMSQITIYYQELPIPKMSFRDEVVYGKVGVGIVWEPVLVSEPENSEEWGEITYSSDDPDIVSINESTGQILPEDVKKAGTVTITATMASTAKYGQGSASYLLVILDPSVTTASSIVTFDFTKKNAYGLTTTKSTDVYETSKTEISSDKDDLVTIKFSGKYRSWDSNGNYDLRLYADATFTVEVPDGCKITKIGLVATNNPSSYANGKFNPAGKEDEEDDNLDVVWVPANDGATITSVTYTATTQDRISTIFVQYESEGSSLKTPDLSFPKPLIHDFYENEEVELSAVRNPENRTISYEIENLDPSLYSITPSADGKTIKVLVKRPGYYSLQATSEADDEYSKGFAIMRLNVYRHLNVYVDLSEDKIEVDAIETNGKAEPTIITMDVPLLTHLYYKIEAANAAAVQADDEDEYCLDGFTLYNGQIEIPAGTHGNLVFYIAAYGYYSPQRTISLDGLARLVEEGKLIKLTHNNVLGQLHVEYAFSLENHNGTEPEMKLQVFNMLDEEVTDFAPVQNPATQHAVIARAASHDYNGKLVYSGEGLLDPMRCGHLRAVLTAKVGDQEVQIHEEQLAGEIQTGIENVAVDAAADAEFFTLEGIRVSEPAAGQFYIKRQGGKAVKVLVK